MSIEDLIQTYGYFAILVFTFLEGETVMVLGGLAAHLGYLELPWVIVSGLAGSFFGDQLYFYVGRHYGPRILAKRLSWKVNAEKVYKHLYRHKNLLILTFRFYYGLRSVTPFAIGASQISPLRFFSLNLTGAIIWSITLGMVGYLFGEAFKLFVADFRHLKLYVLALLAVVGVVIWAVVRVRERKRARERGLG
ncbi:MAG: DedA family protein [Gammaproteobacteria bacterium]|nr:DedA family protein [Gammaproteobacteria bacterium]